MIHGLALSNFGLDYLVEVYAFDSCSLIARVAFEGSLLFQESFRVAVAISPSGFVLPE
jgi:hypothetical protein